MRYSNIFFFFALSLLVAFSSCKKEEINNIKEEPTEEVKPEITRNNVLVRRMEMNSTTSTEGLDLGCFSVDLPFDLIVDDVTVTITDAIDFEAVLIAEPLYVDFAYPVNITYPDGGTGVVADGEELGEAFASCIPDVGWTTDGFPAFLISELNSCYQMVYPVNLLDVDGNVLTANDENEFINLIANNFELYFEFPASFVDTDGNTVTAQSDEDLFALLADCEEIYDPGNGGIDSINITFGEGLFGCYDLQFPVDVVNEDGDVTTITNENDWTQAWLNGDFVDFAFPVTLINEDGVPVVFNNHQELCDAVLECYDVAITDGIDALFFFIASDDLEGTCYSINYPFSFEELVTGAIIEVADAQAAFDILNQSGPNFGTVVLPVQLTLLATGETVTIENIEDYFQALADCE